MPPPRLGTVYRSPDDTHWIARVRMLDGSKSPPIHFDPDVSETDARKQAAEWSSQKIDAGENVVQPAKLIAALFGLKTRPAEDV